MIIPLVDKFVYFSQIIKCNTYNTSELIVIIKNSITNKICQSHF